ncbi:hypothetical protein ACSNN6_28340 [Brevibacillus formosus]
MRKHIKKNIGSGVYRDVYDIGNGLVLKVAKSKYGRCCNKKEVKMYMSSPYSVRKHLGRILEFDRDFSSIKMIKYVRKFPLSKIYRRKLMKTIAYFRNHGILPFDVITGKGKPRVNNLRLKRDGNIVFIDYGNFLYRR